MKSIRSLFRSLGFLTILLALAAFSAAQVSQPQMAAPASMPAQNSFCGNQPFCYEANDLAATITDFRTSTSGYYKVIDVIVRFQSKTNRPLILAYVAGSGTALDDRGNRYGVGGGNALRGIGQSYGGNNFDPKFSIPPGGFGDAQFELIWAPGQTVYGLTFELNLTIDEINTVEGNQHTLGGEFPLHYRGLSNGVVGSSQGQSSAYQGQGTASSASSLPPCGTTATSLAGAANSAGVQAPPSANNAASNASATFSSLGSLFGKKKTSTTTPVAAPTTTSAAPCAPATTSDGSAASTLLSPVNGSGQSATDVTSSTTGTMYSTTNGGAPTPGTTAAPAPAAKAVAVKSTQPAGGVKTSAPPATVKTAAAPPPAAAVKKPVPPPPPAKKPATTN